MYLSLRGISFSDMARRLGVEDSTVLRWCSQARLPGVRWANAIEEATDGEVPASSWGAEQLPPAPVSKPHPRRVRRSVA